MSETVYALSAYEGSTSDVSRVRQDSDNVFSDDTCALQLATVTGDSTSGYQINLTVGVDTTTQRLAAAWEAEHSCVAPAQRRPRRDPFH